MAQPNAAQEPSDLATFRACKNVRTIAYGLWTKKATNSVHGAPLTPLAYEKIDPNVSVGNVPSAAWYETDILADSADHGQADKNRRLTTKAPAAPGPANLRKSVYDTVFRRENCTIHTVITPILTLPAAKLTF